MTPKSFVQIFPRNEISVERKNVVEISRGGNVVCAHGAVHELDLKELLGILESKKTKHELKQNVT